MTVVIDCDKEIEKLKNEKEKLIDKFVADAEAINAQIKYLRRLKDSREITNAK